MPDVKIRRSDGMGRRGPLPRKRIEIAEWVRREIVLGQLAPGDRLPSRAWFQKRFTPNVNVVQSAFAELASDGFVETRGAAARGTVVARRPPYAGRYLLLLKSQDLDGGSNFFSPALESAARVLEKRRHVKFDVMRVADAGSDESEAYARAVERVRRHLYSGVFVQHDNRKQGLDTVLNLDYVPMVYFGAPSEFAQGNWVCSVSSANEVSWTNYSISRNFKDCVERCLRRLAVFSSAPARRVAAKAEGSVREIARRYGLEIDEDGCHFTSMANWRLERIQFVRLVRLYLRSRLNAPVDAVVLGDDNFLSPFEDACGQVYGRGVKPPFDIFCHCNFPCLPKSRLGATFHGMDCVATLDTFIDYADGRMSGQDVPPDPRIVNM